MPRDMSINRIDTDYVKRLLESSGRTLMMLPDNTRPQGYPTAWPEHLREWIDTVQVVLEADSNGIERPVLKVIRPEAAQVRFLPTMRQITEMETVIFNWYPQLAAACCVRKIPYVARCTGLASLHYPDTGKRVWSWSRLAKHFKQKSRQTPKNWYEDGVNILVEILNK